MQAGGGGDIIQGGAGGGVPEVREVKVLRTPYTASPIRWLSATAPNRVTVTASAYPIAIGGGGGAGSSPGPAPAGAGTTGVIQVFQQ